MDAIRRDVGKMGVDLKDAMDRKHWKKVIRAANP